MFLGIRDLKGPAALRTRIPLSHRVLVSSVLSVLIVLLLFLTALLIDATPPPRIDTTFAGASIHLSADRSWMITSGNCVLLTWDVDGIESIRINGEEMSGSGEKSYCPSNAHSNAQFEITAQDGTLRTFSLSILIVHLPNLALWLVFVVLALFMIIAVYFVVTHRLDEPPPFRIFQVLSVALIVFAFVMSFFAQMSVIYYVLEALRRVFSNPAWPYFGVLLALIIYAPLLFLSLRDTLKSDERRDLVAIGGFFFVALLLYLPFGLEDIGQWESWAYRAYLEGRPSKISIELVSRFWSLGPPTLAGLISADSFAGYHLVYLLMLWGMSTFFYAVLRRLKVSPLFAFLASVLLLAYPVNTGLLSLRSSPHTVNKFLLFVAIYFVLCCREDSTRLRLLGVWLALFFSVGFYEADYAIVLVIPVLWWWQRPSRSWRNVNLSAIWYLVPAAKIAYLALLTISSRPYYGRNLAARAGEFEQFSVDSVTYFLDVVGTVYRQTFFGGWHEALNVVSQNQWIVPTLLGLALTGFIATYLARNSDSAIFPSRGSIVRALLSGLLFILPSIGVLMWSDLYNRELWRMYIYVPIGAAIAVCSLILLIALPIKNGRLRNVVTIGMFLLLLLPALSRLFVQRAHFATSAERKAEVLLQIVKEVPRFDPDARVAILTEMSRSELKEKKIDELWWNMLDSAVYILYENARPKVSFLCILGEHCSTNDLTIRTRYLEDIDDYGEFVFFSLHSDLSVELLRELPLELGGGYNDTYFPERLIDTSAPIPPRALTMLASARRALC